MYLDNITVRGIAQTEQDFIKIFDLIEAEPQYAHVRFSKRTRIYYIRDLAPLGDSKTPHLNTESVDKKKIIYSEYTSQLNKLLITAKAGIFLTICR